MSTREIVQALDEWYDADISPIDISLASEIILAVIFFLINSLPDPKSDQIVWFINLKPNRLDVMDF